MLLVSSVVKDSQIQALNLRLEKAERKLAILRTPPSPQKLPQMQMQPLNLRNSFASAKVADKSSAGKNKGEQLASVLINMS